MISLKFVDRMAIAAMFSVSVAVPLAALTPFAAHADGKVVVTRQVLGEGLFGKIQPGMKSDDVLALIGPPHARIRFAATKTTSWDYRYRDAWGYDAEFSVIFDDAGLVVSKFSARNDL